MAPQRAIRPFATRSPRRTVLWLCVVWVCTTSLVAVQFLKHFRNTKTIPRKQTAHRATTTRAVLTAPGSERARQRASTAEFASPALQVWEEQIRAEMRSSKSNPRSAALAVQQGKKQPVSQASTSYQQDSTSTSTAQPREKELVLGRGRQLRRTLPVLLAAEPLRTKGHHHVMNIASQRSASAKSAVKHDTTTNKRASVCDILQPRASARSCCKMYIGHPTAYVKQSWGDMSVSERGQWETNKCDNFKGYLRYARSTAMSNWPCSCSPGCWQDTCCSAGFCMSAFLTGNGAAAEGELQRYHDATKADFKPGKIYNTSPLTRSSGTGSKPKAFVTLLTGASPEYIWSVIGMHLQLKKFKSAYALIVAATASVTAQGLDMLRRSGMEIRIIESIKSSGAEPRWIDQLTKLRLWTWTDLEQIVFLDADHVIHQPIDDVFGVCKQEFCCAEERWGGINDMFIRREEWKGILPRGKMCNMGFFIATPSIKNFKEMMAHGVQQFRRHGTKWKWHHASMLSEQEYLNVFFGAEHKTRQMVGMHWSVPSQSQMDPPHERLNFFKSLPDSKIRTTHCRFWYHKNCFGADLWRQLRDDVDKLLGTTIDRYWMLHRQINGYMSKLKGQSEHGQRRVHSHVQKRSQKPTQNIVQKTEEKNSMRETAQKHTAKTLSKSPTVAAQKSQWVVETGKDLYHGLFGMVLGYILEMLPYLQARNAWPEWRIGTSSYGAVFPHLLELAYTPTHLKPGEQQHILDLIEMRQKTELTLAYKGNFTYAHELFFRFFRLPRDVTLEARRLSSKLPSTCLALHYRGTDKQKGYLNEATPITPEEFLVLARRFVQRHPTITALYVASDERSFPDLVAKAFPRLRIVYQGIKRGHGIRGLHHKRSYNGRDHGKAALVDALVLGRCHFLLKTSSALSAWSKIFNPAVKAYRVQGFNADWFPDANVPLYWPPDEQSRKISRRVLKKDFLYDMAPNDGGPRKKVPVPRLDYRNEVVMPGKQER